MTRCTTAGRSQEPCMQEETPTPDAWWVYLLNCKDGSIYTGIAKDVDARYRQHAEGKGARYTRMNPPVAIIARRQYPCHREAAQAEWQIKQMSPAAKRQWAATAENSTTPTATGSQPLPDREPKMG